MALALDASAPANATGTGTTITTASFTPPAGAVIVLMYGGNNPGSGADVSVASVTNTGTAATWTRRARKNMNVGSTGGIGTAAGAEIWTGTAPGGAITITATGTGTGAGNEKMLRVMVVTGADTTALTNVAAASSASGLPSVAVAGCSVGSYLFAASSDWSQKGLGTAGTTPAQTIISESNVAGQITIHSWRTTSTLASSGSQTMNLSAPAAQQFNIVALEVKDAGGGGGADPLPPYLIMPTIRTY